jgi:hypothetical protein
MEPDINDIIDIFEASCLIKGCTSSVELISKASIGKDVYITIISPIPFKLPVLRKAAYIDKNWIESLYFNLAPLHEWLYPWATTVNRGRWRLYFSGRGWASIIYWVRARAPYSPWPTVTLYSTGWKVSNMWKYLEISRNIQKLGIKIQKELYLNLRKTIIVLILLILMFFSCNHNCHIFIFRFNSTFSFYNSLCRPYSSQRP